MANYGDALQLLSTEVLTLVIEKAGVITPGLKWNFTNGARLAPGANV